MIQKNEMNRAKAVGKRSYETKRPPEKEMIFGVRAVMEAIDAGKVLDKVLVRRDMSSANGTPIADPMVFTTDPKEFINWLKY